MADEAVKVDSPVVEEVAATEPVVAEPAVAEPAVTEPAADNATAEDAKVDTKEEATEADSEVKEDKPAEEASSTGILKTTRQLNQDRRKNNKFDPSVLPVTDDAGQIRGQVEFYFSDSNLPKDEFLWDLVGGTENKPVELKTICSFKRMRRFQPYEAVVKALQESHVLKIDGEEGKETVVRKIPFDPSKPRNLMERSVYVKGFGDEQPSTQFDIEAFFAKFDTVNAIRLRRTGDNLFKGSVFAEFDTVEQAKAFLALDPAPKWKGHDLKIMSKEAYVAEKSQLIAEGKLQPTESTKFDSRRGRGRGRARGGFNSNNRNSDPNDWKSRREGDRKNGYRPVRGARGGRSRGRGGNRDRRDNREQKNGDRNEDSENKEAKRPRDDDASAEEPPAKKVDTKTEAAPAPVEAAE